MITVSVVSHAQGALVQRLLDDLARLASPRVARLVVTRNVAEAWRPPARLGSCAVALVDNAAPRGFGANHNAAFAHCATPYFAVVNPDIRLPRDPFEAVLARFGAGARTALVSPRIVNPAGEVEDFARALMTPAALLRRRLASGAHEDAPAWLAGMFMVFRADAFRALGGFDERFFMYCEDADICARLRLANWRYAIAGEASVVHDAQRASHRSLRHLRWHVASLLRMWSSRAFWRYRALLAREAGAARA